MISETQKAYIAGFIDNFGGIRVRETTAGTPQPTVFVHGNKLVTLNMLAELTETSVTPVGRPYKRHRCNEHCPEKHDMVVSHSYRWQVTGLKCTILLWNIKPYMMVRDIEAGIACEVGLGATFKGYGLEKMKQLGWDISVFDKVPKS